LLAIILSVVVISLSGVMMPGPMFAVTIAKSYRSPWAGTKIAIGHAIVEVPLILLIYFGFARFFQRDGVQIALSLIGGAVIIWLGVNMFRARKEVVASGHDLKYGAITAGIVMSVINPLFLLWWATVGSMLVMKFVAFGTIGLPVLIITHWVCDLIWLSIVFTPDLSYQSAMGYEVAGVDICRLQPVASGLRCLVFDFGYSENQPVTFYFLSSDK